MVEVEYFILCENVVVDKTDKVSLINIFDAVNAQALPTICPKLTFAFSIIPDKKDVKAGNLTFKLDVTSPSKVVMLSMQGEGQEQSEAVKKADVVKIVSSLDLSGISLEEEGTYLAELSLNNEKIATRPFQLILARKEQ